MWWSGWEEWWNEFGLKSGEKRRKFWQSLIEDCEICGVV